MNFIINCVNHGCSIRDACFNYLNPDGEEEFIRPSIIFLENNKPKIVCSHLHPANINIVAKHIHDSKVGYQKKLKLKYDIVDEFGGEDKVKLMKQLNALTS